MVSKKKLAAGIALIVVIAYALIRLKGTTEPAVEEESDHAETG